MGLSEIDSDGCGIIGIDAPYLWRDFLGRFPAPDVYFQPEYVNLYTDAQSFVETFIYQTSDGLLFLPYLRRTISGQEGLYDFETAYGYGGPLSTNPDPAFLKRAWMQFREYASQNGMVAGFIRFHPLLKNHHLANPEQVDVVFQRETVSLTLERSQEEVWAQYEGDTRNKVRKAQKAGVVVERMAGEEALDRFREMYVSTMDRAEADASYYFTPDYFRSFSRFLSASYAVYLACLGDAFIGGALVFFSDRFVHLHLSASVTNYMRLAPASLIRHAVIHDWLGSGREKIHFGGGRTNDPNDSLLRFKKGFSRERERFYIGKCVVNRKTYDRLRAEWAASNPEKVSRYGAYFLCYRY